MKFVKHTTGRKQGSTLCNLSIVPVSKPQVFKLLLRGLGDNYLLSGSEGCSEVCLSLWQNTSIAIKRFEIALKRHY